MPQAVVIPANDTELIRYVSTNATLDDLKAFVGGYIEAVELPDAVLFVNEEGKIHDLNRNRRATELCRTVGGMVGDWIAGDAVVLGWDPSTDTYLDVPTALLELLGGRRQ